MKIEIKVRELAESRGIPNPFALQSKSGVNYAVCHKLWNGTPKMISLETLAKLCDALACQPGDILVKTEKKTSSRRTATR